MIVLIIWEAIWIFCLWWDHSKPLGILLNIVMMAVPIILAINDIAKKEGRNLRKWDSALFESGSEQNEADDTYRAICFMLDNEENKRREEKDNK